MPSHATDAVSPLQGLLRPNSRPRVPARAARTSTLGCIRTPARAFSQRFRRARPRACTGGAGRRSGSVLQSAVIALLLFQCSCGYHVAGAVKPMPDGIKSLGVPTFQNRSPNYRLEQRITGAVLKEFAIRTRTTVNSQSSGVDAVLVGEIRSFSSTPVTFGANTFASTFLVTVQMGVKLVRTRDSVVLWENPDFLFRERYVLNPNVTEFFSEENPALERLAREFAETLVGTILNR